MNPEDRRCLVAGLRDLARYLEVNPEIPTPPFIDAVTFPEQASDEAMCAEIDKIAAHLGTAIDERYRKYGHYRTRKSFGPVSYSAVAILSIARQK